MVTATAAVSACADATAWQAALTVLSDFFAAKVKLSSILGCWDKGVADGGGDEDNPGTEYLIHYDSLASEQVVNLYIVI